jgi:hypothetical protein
VLTFSLRSEANRSLNAARTQIEEAMGCPLVSGDIHGIPGFQGRVLGMRLILLAWRGIDRVQHFQFAGIPDDPAYSPEWEFLPCDISQAVADLLEARHGVKWWIPSDTEIQAEVDFDGES